MKGSPPFFPPTFSKTLSPRVFEILFRRRLFHHKLGEDEVAFEDRFDFAGLDKLIESFAPSSPGGIEGEENGFVIFGSLGSGFRQHFVRRGRCLSQRDDGWKKRCKNSETEFCTHG